MTTEQTFDQMLDLLPYISNVLADPKLRELGQKMRPGKDGHPAELDSLGAMEHVFPVMLTTHREDLYGILAVQMEKTPEEVKKLPFADIRQTLQSDSMRAFFDFFPFLLQMVLHA